MSTREVWQHGGMSGDERCELTPEQRAGYTSAARALDDAVDLLLPCQENESAAGLLSHLALYAEALRANARGAYETAAEYMTAAMEHWDGGQIRIRIVDDPERR